MNHDPTHSTKHKPNFLHWPLERPFFHRHRNKAAASSLALLALAGCGEASASDPSAVTVNKTVKTSDDIEQATSTASPETTSSPKHDEGTETKEPGIASQMEMIEAMQPNETIETLAGDIHERVESFYAEGAYVEGGQAIFERYPNLKERLNDHHLAAIQQLNIADLTHKKVEIDKITERQLLGFDDNGTLSDETVTIDKVKAKDSNEVGIPFNAAVTDYLNEEWYPEGIQSIESEHIAQQLFIDAINSGAIGQLNRLNEQVNTALSEYVSDGVTVQMQRIEDKLPTVSELDARTLAEAKHYVTEAGRLQVQTNIDIHKDAVLKNGFTGSVDNGYFVAANTYYIDNKTGEVNPAVTDADYKAAGDEADENVTRIFTTTILGEYTDDAENVVDAELRTLLFIPVDKLSTRDNDGTVIISDEGTQFTVVNFRYDTIDKLTNF